MFLAASGVVLEGHRRHSFHVNFTTVSLFHEVDEEKHFKHT